MKMYKNSFEKSIDFLRIMCYNEYNERDKKGDHKMFINLMFGAVVLKMWYMAVKF